MPLSIGFSVLDCGFWFLDKFLVLDDCSLLLCCRLRDCVFVAF